MLEGVILLTLILFMEFAWAFFAVRFFLSGYAVGSARGRKPTLLLDMKLLLGWLAIHALLSAISPVTAFGLDDPVGLKLLFYRLQEVIAWLGPAYLAGWVIGNRVGQGKWIPAKSGSEADAKVVNKAGVAEEAEP